MSNAEKDAFEGDANADLVRYYEEIKESGSVFDTSLLATATPTKSKMKSKGGTTTASTKTPAKQKKPSTASKAPSKKKQANGAAKPTKIKKVKDPNAPTRPLSSYVNTEHMHCHLSLISDLSNEPGKHVREDTRSNSY